MNTRPHIHFVGAGPGNPDLLTLRAARLLSKADIVLYDALVGPEILKLITPRTKRICVGKRAGCASMAQSEINRRLVESAYRGHIVVRLKGGDPSMFGRLEEETAALKRAGISYEICPGITAATAAAASLGFPLTERGSVRQVTYVTTCTQDGDLNAIDWPRMATTDQTLVFYMARRACRGIAHNLVAAGMSPQTPIALLSSISLPAQHAKLLTVGELAIDIGAVQGPGPLLLVVGNVLRLGFETDLSILEFEYANA